MIPVARAFARSLSRAVAAPACRAAWPAAARPLRTPFVRYASNSPGDVESEAQKLVSKLHENPEIREILEEFQQLLQSKGFNPSQPPSFMEMMKLFAQKDVRELAKKLKNKFEEAGIEISPDQMNSFMEMMKK